MKTNVDPVFGIRNNSCLTYSIPLISDSNAIRHVGKPEFSYGTLTFLPCKEQLRMIKISVDKIWCYSSACDFCGKDKDIFVIGERGLRFLFNKVGVFNNLVREGVFSVFSVGNGRKKPVAMKYEDVIEALSE